MKEMAGDEIKDSKGPLGPEYRVVRPCLRGSGESFVVEDLRYGAARRLVVVTEDRPGIRAAADRARRVVHDRIARLHRVDTDASGRLLLVEDDHSTLVFVKALLKSCGHTGTSPTAPRRRRTLTTNLAPT